MKQFRRVAGATLIVVLAAVAAVVWLAPSPWFEQARQHQGEIPVPPPGTMPLAVTGNDLVERARELDGQWVQFQGEAIGDLMRRGDWAWLNVSDANYAIGVLMPGAEAAKVQVLGNYHFTGDTVRVTGIFHRADPQQGGDLDIVASEVAMVTPGQRRVDPRPAGRIFWAAGLSLIALAVFVAARAHRREPTGGFEHGGFEHGHHVE